VRGADLDEMTAFVAIAEHGGFSKAARRLGMAVSTLSHRIRKLEERLGVRLLNRTTRSIALTAAGQKLLRELRPALLTLETAADIVGEFRDHLTGHLRLTVAPPAANSIIAPALAGFLAQHPGISVEISVDGASVDIVEGGFDAGLRTGALVQRDMIGVRVGPPVQFRVLASPVYIERMGAPRTPDDLAGHNCLRVRLPNGALLPWRFQSGDRVFDAPVKGGLILNDRDLELSLALDGAGIIHTLSNRPAGLVAAGRLTALLQDWTPPPVDFLLYHSSRRQVPPALRAFIDHLRARNWDETPTPAGAAFS
jgi:DNA-binding transcriptional LysR family regulator